MIAVAGIIQRIMTLFLPCSGQKDGTTQKAARPKLCDDMFEKLKHCMEYHLFLLETTRETPQRSTEPTSWPKSADGVHYPPIGAIINDGGRQVLIVGYKIYEAALIVCSDLSYIDKAAEIIELDPSSYKNRIELISFFANNDTRKETYPIRIDKESCLKIEIVDFDFSQYYNDGQLALELF